MGLAASALIKQHKPFWEGEHELQIDAELGSTQRTLVNKLRESAKLCRVSSCGPGLAMQHWYITDGAYIIEYGDAALMDRSLKFFASSARDVQVVQGDFKVDEEVRRRLKAVCGATNFSIALRNSEHMAKFIAFGCWISLQMVSSTDLFKALKPALGDRARLVNVPPKELVKFQECVPSPDPIYPDFESPFSVEFSGVHRTLGASAGGLTMVVLGPTGVGKSSIINALFNCMVAKVTGGPRSVTQRMDIYLGSFLDPSSACRHQINVIDTIGFCDSAIPPEDVVHVVKDYIKANALEVLKVIIVCASRIEKAQADAIKNFMKWLRYDKHKSNFVFVYNKAEEMSEGAREQAVNDMCELLGADPRHSAVCKDGNELRHVSFALAAGFPRRGPPTSVKVKADLGALYNAVFRMSKGHVGIRISESDCPIL